MGMTVKHDAKNKKLIIEIDANTTNPPRSKGGEGKTLIVSSSKGNKETEVMVDGKPVYVGINAYIYAD